MIVITGATGKLGHLVVEELLRKVQPSQIAVAVRNLDKASDFRARGIEVRVADYDKPETLRTAFKRGEKLLMISGSEAGRRISQHRAVIEAAKNAGISLLVYTSALHADNARFKLADEHRETEKMIRASGIPFVILRNGWYLENYTENLASALQHGAILGSAGQGRVGAAARADYAAAAAAVLTSPGHENKIYELAGDQPFTMDELAADVSRAAGKEVVYKNLPADEYANVLAGVGLPKPYAEILADSDLGIERRELQDDSGDLRRLIGRPTMALSEAVRKAVKH